MYHVTTNIPKTESVDSVDGRYGEARRNSDPVIESYVLPEDGGNNEKQPDGCLAGILQRFSRCKQRVDQFVDDHKKILVLIGLGIAALGALIWQNIIPLATLIGGIGASATGIGLMVIGGVLLFYVVYRGYKSCSQEAAKAAHKKEDESTYDIVDEDEIPVKYAVESSWLSNLRQYFTRGRLS
jgi:hypothetical protein